MVTSLRSIFVTVMLFALLGSTTGYAQISDEQRANRRTFVQGLLKGLLESQIEKARNPPQRPIYPQPQQAVPVARPPVSGEMKRVRKTLKNWSNECDNLIENLRQAEGATPAVRPLLAEALQVRVNIDLLSRKAKQVPDVNYLVEDFRAVDQQWRMLNYHLDRLPAVAVQVDQCVGLSNQYDQELLTIFDVQPQYDIQQVLQLNSQLSTSLNNLSQNLRYEIRQEPARSQLIRKSQSLQRMMQQAPPVIRRGDYAAVTRIFEKGLKQWHALNHEIGRYPSPRLRHDVQDIEGIGRQLQEQLFIPYQIDREYLAQLSSSVGAGASTIFQQISLQDLMTLKKPATVLESARAFERQCNGFSGALQSGVDESQLASRFGRFESNWNGLHTQCQAIKNPAVQLQLGEVDYAMQTLRGSFGAQPLLDHNSMLRIAASLEDLSHELEDVAVGTPSSIFRPINVFHERCFDLNQKTIANRFYEPSFAELDQMFKSWGQFKRASANYRGKKAGPINNYRRQIEPLVVKMQVIYGH